MPHCRGLAGMGWMDQGREGGSGQQAAPHLHTPSAPMVSQCSSFIILSIYNIIYIILSIYNIIYIIL